MLSYELLGIILLCSIPFSVIAQPASLSFTTCATGNDIDPARKINVSTVYGQVINNNVQGKYMNLTVIGNTGQEIIPISNETGLLCANSFRNAKRAWVLTRYFFLSYTVHN